MGDAPTPLQNLTDFARDRRSALVDREAEVRNQIKSLEAELAHILLEMRQADLVLSERAIPAVDEAHRTPPASIQDAVVGSVSV